MPAPKDPEKYKEWIEKLKKRTVWNKGKKLTDPKYSVAGKKNKGRKSPLKGIKRGPIHSEETKKRISEKMKGKRQGFASGGKHSEETKKKMSLSHKGKVLGPRTEKEKEAISKAVKKKFQENPEIVQKIRNRKWTEESKKKLNESLKSYRQTPAGKELAKKIGKLASERNKGAKLPKSWVEAISRGVSRAVVEGKLGIPKNCKNGYYESSKAGTVFYRSSYELIVFKSLDQDRNVESFEVEPMSIRYEYGGIVRNYTPDIFITYKNGSKKVVEIKPQYQLQDPINQAKFKAAKALFGDNFEIWTENELDTKPV